MLWGALYNIERNVGFISFSWNFDYDENILINIDYKTVI